MSPIHPYSLIPGTRPGIYDMSVAQRLFRVEGRLVGEGEREGNRDIERETHPGSPVVGTRCLNGQESVWLKAPRNI